MDIPEEWQKKKNLSDRNRVNSKHVKRKCPDLIRRKCNFLSNMENAMCGGKGNTAHNYEHIIVIGSCCLDAIIDGKYDLLK